MRDWDKQGNNDKGDLKKALILISLAYLGALFGICFLILQQIRTSSEKAAGAFNAPNDPSINRIGAASTARLEEAKQTPISITENTTRTLDEVLAEER